MKTAIENILYIAGMCILASLASSIIRAMGHDTCYYAGGDKTCPNTPCQPLYIDKLEPVVSTRWFCEVIK